MLDVYQRTLIGVRKDLMSRYMTNLKSGKYRNPETGAIDYDLALSDAQTLLTILSSLGITLMVGTTLNKASD